MVADGIRALGDVGWAVADLLRGSMTTHQHGKGALPLTLLRRMDCLRRDEPELRGKAMAERGSVVSRPLPPTRRRPDRTGSALRLTPRRASADC